MASVHPSSTPSFTVHPLHPNVGVEIRGLDLREPPDPETGAALRDLLPQHGVLLFRDVDITEEQQVAFSRTFGDLEVHVEGNIRNKQRREFVRISNVDEDGNIIDPKDSARRYLYELTCMWHTDSSFRKIPALASLLYALDVPEPGTIPDTDGRTCYVDMCHAYETLSEETKQRIDDMRTVHDYVYSRGLVADMPGISAEDAAKVPPVEHPLVRTHPDGRKSIYVSSTHTSHIIGLPGEESRAMLDELLAWATRDECVYSHQWRNNDLVMWDNRVTMHRVTPYDQYNVRRALRRTTVAGDGPVV